MVTFLNLIAAEPDISPRAGDCHRFLEVVGDRGRAEMRPGQGRRQLDQPEGRRGAVCRTGAQDQTLRRRRRSHGLRRKRPGGNRGRASSRICERSYKILTETVGFPPEDIIFDPNIFAVATGIPEHNDYAVAFIEAARLIRENLPHCHVSGGLSNVSFSFPRQQHGARGDPRRLSSITPSAAGMDMGIVNAGPAHRLRRHSDRLARRRRGCVC